MKFFSFIAILLALIAFISAATRRHKPAGKTTKKNHKNKGKVHPKKTVNSEAPHHF